MELERTEYVRADIRNPLILKVLQTTEVDTLIHMSILAAPPRAGGRGQMKEMNVIGTMQLFAACQRAEHLRNVVMKSTTAVYGAGPRNPAMYTEDMSARESPQGGYAKDAVEIEQYARQLARRRPELGLTTLRFANFIGPEIRSSLTRYFELPVVPRPLGFDPRLQFVHENDALDALERVTIGRHRGLYNVAADGIVLLSQALRLLGRPSFPVAVPLGAPLAAVLRRLGRVDFSADQLSLLIHGRVVDNARIKRELDWTPRYTTSEALMDFARGRKLRRAATRERIADWEEDLQAFLRRTRQARFERSSR